MNEQERQKWIGLVMDLMVAYRQMLGDHSADPDAEIRSWCDRVADAVGDGATGEFVYKTLKRRMY